MKTTLAYGRNFHFYQEGSNNDYVYLELEDAPYDAGYRRIMIAIPIDVWEVIRSLGETHLELVNSSDEELHDIVQGKVDERIAEYLRVRSSSAEKAELVRFNNSVIFGAADKEREQQIVRGMQYYRTERERQRGIALRIAQHKVIDINTELPEEKGAET
jgi:hypothetical protein